MPGTRNQKYRAAPVVSVVQETGRVYELSELVDPLPEQPRQRRAAAMTRTTNARTDGLPVRLSERAQQVWTGTTAKRTLDG